jgi:hypothetical protein
MARMSVIETESPEWRSGAGVPNPKFAEFASHSGAGLFGSPLTECATMDEVDFRTPRQAFQLDPHGWWEVDGIEPLAAEGRGLRPRDGTSLSLLALPETVPGFNSTAARQYIRDRAKFFGGAPRNRTLIP